MKTSTRALLALVGLALASPVQAETCPDQQKVVLGYLTEVQKVGQAATTLAVKCLYSGTDDTSFDKLVGDARRAFKADLSSVKREDCFKTQADVSGLFGNVGNGTGQTLGFAYVACSSKVQAQLKQLKAAGKSADEIKAELKKSIETFVAAELMK